jgi:general transcriptional corepressor CYC8
MGAQEDAIYAYEQALRINPQAVNAMNAISVVLRGREEFPKAAEFLQAALKLDPNNGEAWGSLGKLLVTGPAWSFLLTPPWQATAT